jgi:hypothetical protein
MQIPLFLGGDFLQSRHFEQFSRLTGYNSRIKHVRKSVAWDSWREVRLVDDLSLCRRCRGQRLLKPENKVSF